MRFAVAAALVAARPRSARPCRVARLAHRPAAVRPRGPRLRRCLDWLVLLAALAPPAHSQELELSIYSTAAGGGALVVDGVLESRVTPRLRFFPGGICPYSSINPGFVTPTLDRAAEGLYALAPGTGVSFVAVAIDDAASVKIGGTVVDLAGESAPLGTASGLHVHPEWQVQAPQGEIGAYAVTFTLTTTSARYDASPPYTLLLSNAAAASPSPTAQRSEPPTATPSPSPSPSPGARCAGDCNGDGTVGVSELITGVNAVLGSAAADTCRAFDRNGDGAIEIAELIQGVNALLGGCRP